MFPVSVGLYLGKVFTTDCVHNFYGQNFHFIQLPKGFHFGGLRMGVMGMQPDCSSLLFLPVEVQSLAAGMGLAFTQLCHDSVLLASLALGCCLCRCLKDLKNAVKCGCFCPGCSFPFTIVLLCVIIIKAMSLCISTSQNQKKQNLFNTTGD